MKSKIYLLPTLCEFFSKFTFWGIQSLLILYFIQLHVSADHAYSVIASFISISYLSCIVGGYISNKLIGYKNTISYGLISMVIGMFCILFRDINLITSGLAFISVGIGIVSPNTFALLSECVDNSDSSSNDGKSKVVTLFYAAANAGVVTGPIIFGYLYLYLKWSPVTLIATVILALWVIFYLSTQRIFLLNVGDGQKNTSRTIKHFSTILFVLVSVATVSFILTFSEYFDYFAAICFLILLTVLTRLYRKSDTKSDLLLIFVLLIIALIFYASEFQVASSFIDYAKSYVQRDVFSLTIPASAFLSLESIFVVLFSPLAIYLSKRLSLSNINKAVLGVRN